MIRINERPALDGGHAEGSGEAEATSATSATSTSTSATSTPAAPTTGIEETHAANQGSSTQPTDPDDASARLIASGEAGGQSQRSKPTAVQGLAVRDWQPAQRKKIMLHDLELGFGLLRTLPPAVTFFGGARIDQSDHFYSLGMELGSALADAGVAARTGAGPGIMQAIPEGFKNRLDDLEVGGPLQRDDLSGAERAFAPVVAGFSQHVAHGASETQGFNLCLPHEQAINPAIDNVQELVSFAYRKLMLYENVRGIVTFPGGYGTLDELFEVWALSAIGRHHDPLVAVGEQFWSPILETIRDVAVDGRGLIKEDEMALMGVADTADRVLDLLAADTQPVGFESDPDQLAKRLAREISQAVDTIDRLPPAVTVAGAEGLDSADPTCEILRQAAAELTRAGVNLRVGGSKAVIDAATSGAQRVDASAKLQGIFLGKEHAATAMPAVETEARVEEYSTYKEMLGNKIEALVALPGDLRTLDQVFTVLCQVQTKKKPPIPIVLVGKDYWQPIFDRIGEVMLNSDRHTIAPGDLDLVTITDDPKQVASAILSG